MTDKPQVKPPYPYFSSGPCAKPPGWSLKNLENLSNKLEYVFEIKTQEFDPNSEIRPTF